MTWRTRRRCPTGGWIEGSRNEYLAYLNSSTDLQNRGKFLYDMEDKKQAQGALLTVQPVHRPVHW